jgi:tetratricopeptide (TPR) repeat protein
MKTLFATLCAVLAAASSAGAAVTVLSGGQAAACFEAAKGGRSDDNAVATCDLALETEMLAPPDRGGTLINRGVIKLRRGQFEAAHVDFDAGIALIPEVGEGWINRGAMFVGEHKYRDGLGDLDKGLTLGVKEPEKAYFNRALAHEGLDDEKAAYLDFQQASTLKPDWDAPKQELKRFTVSTR